MLDLVQWWSPTALVLSLNQKDRSAALHLRESTPPEHTSENTQHRNTPLRLHETIRLP